MAFNIISDVKRHLTYLETQKISICLTPSMLLHRRGFFVIDSTPLRLSHLPCSTYLLLG